MFNTTTRKSFLSKVLQPVMQRTFSRTAVQAFLSADEKTQAAEQAKDINSAFNGNEWQDLQTYSRTTHLRKKQEETAAEAEWLSQLRSPQQKEGIFAQICKINDEDHGHLKQVKRRIDKLVKHELEALRFDEQLKQEERDRLAQ